MKSIEFLWRISKGGRIVRNHQVDDADIGVCLQNLIELLSSQFKAVLGQRWVVVYTIAVGSGLPLRYEKAWFREEYSHVRDTLCTIHIHQAA